MAHGRGGSGAGHLGGGAGMGTGHVGYMTGMVMGVCALLGLFWLPFKYPKAFFALVGIMVPLSVVAYFFGLSNALDNPSSPMWIPVFGIGYLVYRRYMAPKD